MVGAVLFLFFLGLIWVAIATICDIRKREVPNWLNFSLIIIALAFRYFYSAFNSFDFFIFGALGFGFYFLLAYLFYYGKVFAGGDAKLLMGLGAVLPLFSGYFMNLKMMVYFVLVFMIAGSLYGMGYSVVLVFVNLRRFIREFANQFRRRWLLVFISLFFAIAALIFAFYAGGIAWVLPGIILLLPFLYVYAKSVEEACMVRAVPAGILTEGDWLYRSVRVGNRVIQPKWEGLTKRQVLLLHGNKKKVLVKQGIPFIPAFFFAYLFFFGRYLLGWF